MNSTDNKNWRNIYLYLCPYIPWCIYQWFIDRLENIRRGAAGLADEYAEGAVNSNEVFSGGTDIQLQPDSAESSVEGK